MLHGRNAVEARSRRNAFRPEFFAAPGSDDQIGCSLEDLLYPDHTVLGGALIPSIREDVHTASDLDQFRNPSNSGDQRIVPFLEEYPWLLR